jgi:hypothetical protein
MPSSQLALCGWSLDRKLENVVCTACARSILLSSISVRVPAKGQKRGRQEGVEGGEGDHEYIEKEARRKRNKIDRDQSEGAEGGSGSEDLGVEEDMDLEIEGHVAPGALAVVPLIDTTDVNAHICADYHPRAVLSNNRRE